MLKEMIFVDPILITLGLGIGTRIVATVVGGAMLLTPAID
jgi:hypothetical protein